MSFNRTAVLCGCLSLSEKHPSVTAKWFCGRKRERERKIKGNTYARLGHSRGRPENVILYKLISALVSSFINVLTINDTVATV